MYKNLLSIIKLIEKNNLFLFITLICVKLIVIPFTSESFDTATYLYQVKRLYDFDFIALDNWNKSCVLLYIYKISYSAYIIFIETFQLTKDKLTLFHIFFKAPLVLSDFWIGVILYKLGIHLKFTKKQNMLAVLFWLVNPFVWYSAYMKGQYEIIVALVLLLSMFFLLKRKFTFSIITLATAFAFKYVFIILLPLYLLIILNKKIKSYKLFNIVGSHIKYLIVFGSIFILSYLVNIIAFIDFTSLSNTSVMLSMHYGSVLNFLGSNNSLINIGTPSVDGPIFKAIYYLIYGMNPTMDNQTYGIWQNFFSIYLFGCILIFLYLKLSYLFLIKKSTYNDLDIIYLIIIILSFFYLTQSKIEAHWYLWSIPILILLCIYYKRSILKLSLSFTLLITTAVFGSGPQKFHFANLNTNFDKYLPQWTKVNFSENINIFLFTSFLIYLIYFLTTLKKRARIYNEYSLYLSVFVNILILLILVYAYTIPSVLIVSKKNPTEIPTNSISASRTWYYSTAIDPVTERPYFPSIATKYIAYLFKSYSKIFKENFILVLDKNTYLKNKQKLPPYIPSKDKYLYYFEFEDIKHLFEIKNELMYINLENATRATLMHSFDSGYAESYYFIKQKRNNLQYQRPYYLKKYRNEIFFNALVFYSAFLFNSIFFTFFYYNLARNKN